MGLDDFARYPLLFGPSPVHRLDRLTRHLGGARLRAKREDCDSGIAYGGDKTRKLEYLVPDALARGRPGASSASTRRRSPPRPATRWPASPARPPR